MRRNRLPSTPPPTPSRPISAANPEEICVIGAGPAGLAAAATLQQGGRALTLVEKQPQVGGLARTMRFDEDGLLFRTDNGPHRFYSKNPDLYAFIEGVLGEHWIEVPRCTRQFIDGRFYDYPIDLPQALRNIGPRRAARFLADYAAGRTRYGLLGQPVTSFEDHIVAHFGRGLGELNMINYTEKIWGIPASQIHPDWATQRIKGLSLRETVKTSLARLLQADVDGPRSMIDSFYYPDTGTGLIYETITDQLRAAGNPVHLDTQPVRIVHDGRRVTEVVLSGSAQTWTVRPEYLVETVPVLAFLELLDPAPPDDVLAAARALRSRSQVYLFLTLDVPQVGPDQWIYFPDRAIPFGRISEMRNFSAAMSPPGKTSLFVEYFCWTGDDVWMVDRQALTDRTVQILSDLGFIRPEQVRRSYLLRASDVYPVYDLEYPERLARVKGWLDGLENLHYIGRPGRFRYNNQDHSLEMGILAGRGILEGFRADYDAVGAEHAYLEAGAHPAGPSVAPGAGG